MVEFPSKDWKDYELLDSGCGEKLERFGQIITVRPEPKALWDKSMSDAEWRRLAHFSFKLASAQNGGRDAVKGGKNAGSGAIEDRGTWERHKKADEQWYIRYGADTGSASVAGAAGASGPQFRLRLGLTAFKHVGIFPEQAPNWEFIYRQVRRLAGNAAGSGPERTANTGPERTANTGPERNDVGGGAAGVLEAAPPPKVLNLFAYTGGATLAAKAAGADVTHLDSIKQVVTWARGNMEASGMDGIRWIVEDAMKFVQREERRGNLYDGIILDPPAYGHGPNGEKWKLDDSLFGLLRSVSHILKPQNSFMVLNLYSNGYSAALGETLVRQAFGRDFACPSPVAEGQRDIIGRAMQGPGAPCETQPLADGQREIIGRAMQGPGSPCETQPYPLPVAESRLEIAGPGGLTSGELALNDRFGKALPLSIYVRLSL